MKLLFIILLVAATCEAVTVYDYNAGAFQILPSTSSPSYSVITASSGTISNATIQLISGTTIQLQAKTVAAGTIAYCTNCAVPCAISTGTLNSFVECTSSTTKAQ
jgi:hypothetical protein